MQPEKKEASTQTYISMDCALLIDYWAFADGRLNQKINELVRGKQYHGFKEVVDEKRLDAQMVLWSRPDTETASDDGSESSLISQTNRPIGSYYSCGDDSYFAKDFCSADDFSASLRSSCRCDNRSSSTRHRRRSVIPCSSVSRINSQLKRNCSDDASKSSVLQKDSNISYDDDDDDDDSVTEFERLLRKFQNRWSFMNSFLRRREHSLEHLPSESFKSMSLKRSMEDFLSVENPHDRLKSDCSDFTNSALTNASTTNILPRNTPPTTLPRCDWQLPVTSKCRKGSIPVSNRDFPLHRTLSRRNSEPDYVDVTTFGRNLCENGAESGDVLSELATSETVPCSNILIQLEALQNGNSELLLNSGISEQQKTTRSLHNLESNQSIQGTLARAADKESRSLGTDASFVRPVFLHSLSCSVGNLNLERSRLLNQMTIELFALEHFNEHRYGLLGKAIPFNSMLSWTKDCISKPMIRTNNKALKKEAPEVFRLIQMYMSDRKSKLPQMQIALLIIQKNLMIEELRDETFMQLCRQTTNNPKEESLMHGWVLMGICLSAFFPSFRFQTCLMGYICQHMTDSVVKNNGFIGHFASHCKHLLERSSTRRSVKGTLPKININYVEQSLKSIFHPSHFGSSLDDIMQMQKYKFPEKKLPWIQTALSEEMLRLNCERIEGIFRVPGDKDEISVLRSSCDKWELPGNDSDPHVLASLLKQWYRELYEPLIPAELYDECISCSEAEGAVAIVDRLPALSRLVLSYLIRFLQIFAATENSSVSKMDANNLATVMAPNCLHCESEDMQVILKNAPRESNFIKILILNLDTSFINGIW